MGSIAPGEAVFDRYGKPLGFVQSWQAHFRNIDFAAGSRYQMLPEPNVTLELSQYGKEVKVDMARDIDLYDENFDGNVGNVPIEQFGRYCFGLDKLADGLIKAVDLGAITKAEAKKEFRQFVTSIQKDADKKATIKALEKKLKELKK